MAGKKFIACMTHDVDSLSYKRRYRLRGALAARSVEPLRPSFNPCRAFDECVALEKSFGAKSTFFFLDYDERSLREVARAGCEIALHADARTIEDHDSLAKAKKNLEKAATQRVYGLRQHRYPSVKMDFGKAWRNALQADFEYDSSVGRHGVCLDQPFKPSSEIVELPVTAMDASFMYRSRLSPRAAAAETARAIDFTASRGGFFVFITHLNNIFDDYNLPGWRNYYSRVLQACEERGARFLTCREAAKAVKLVEIRRRAS